MSLSGKKIAILVENLYQELEVWYPLLRFKEEGAAVVVVGSGSAKEHTSKFGYPVTVDKIADEVKAADFDAIIIPGGYAPDIMRRYPAMVGLVKDMAKQGKVVAAICHGGWMLASAEVVQGKTVTAFFAIKDDLVHAGANFIDAEVAVDGKLITSRKPEDLPAFCRAIVTALRG
ncbi:MAG: type 1 glutamine amidotransferase [Deltaproteobacteria bacterium]|nr:type 1 glutamine amidotransferase [Deltaproteobacteria bacterium]MBW1951607.1 type 1 glutamine amidotransferase [Deltaproteobacteria bacterium]MBW1986624.1 type 1 glutamine amidotransferase [Deltaproteobacteria bacterium]MBW2134775.1 type 1 glutamine amidotransferase [Deltaproteobacteria bacterium]